MFINNGSNSERRKLPRIKVAWNAAIVADSLPGAQPLKGISLNLTPAGVALQTGVACPVSDNVLVYLMPGGEGGKDDRIFRFRANIVHSTARADTVVTGLRFKENESLARLKEILAGAQPGQQKNFDRGPDPFSPAVAVPARITSASAEAASPAPSPAPPAAPLSLLEKIQAEAAQKLADNAATEDLKRRLHENWCREVDTTLRNAFAYFSELVNSLNILKPQYSGAFAIPCVALIEEMHWLDDARADFKLRKAATEIDRYESLLLTYRWLGKPEKRKVLVRNEDKKACERSLEICGMAFHSEDSQDSSGNAGTLLSFPCMLTCSVTLMADDTTNLLRLRLRNVGTNGIVEYELPLDRLDKALLDEITRAVLGEKSSLDSLCKKREFKTG